MGDRPPHSTFQIDDSLARIGRAQLGLVTVADAAAHGVDHRALARRRAAGSVVPVFAGVVRLTAAPTSTDQTILAAALAVPGSVVGATSAAVVHGMPALAVAKDEPVVIAGRCRSARTSGVRVIRTSYSLPSQPWYTSRVATPSATLVHLARLVDPAVVERCLDHCLANRLVSVRSVGALLARVPPRALPGRRVLLDLLAERSEGIGHRSGLEQSVAPWLNEAGLAGWQRNHRVVVGGSTVEVDYGWPRERVALELSPFHTHGSRAKQERDAVRRRLLVAAGWRVIEATDPDLEHPVAFAAVVESLVQLMSGALAPAERARAHPKLAC